MNETNEFLTFPSRWVTPWFDLSKVLRGDALVSIVDNMPDCYILGRDVSRVYFDYGIQGRIREHTPPWPLHGKEGCLHDRSLPLHGRQQGEKDYPSPLHCRRARGRRLYSFASM